MRVRTAQDFQMQQIGEAMIVVVGRRTGDMPEHILPLRRLADLVQIVVAFVGEDVLAKFEHGALSFRRGGGYRCARRRALH